MVQLCISKNPAKRNKTPSLRGAFRRLAVMGGGSHTELQLVSYCLRDTTDTPSVIARSVATRQSSKFKSVAAGGMQAPGLPRRQWASRNDGD